MMSHYHEYINSILDNDFYKFTMQSAVTRLFPDGIVRYKLFNRGKHKFPEGFGEEMKKIVNDMSKLSLTKAEKQFLLDKCPYLDPVYLDFLEGYRYDPSEVKIIQRGSKLEVRIEGYWYRTILWEVPLLAIISELYYNMTGAERWTDEQIFHHTLEKTRLYNELNIRFAEFGTRRRHSYEVQRIVNQSLIDYKGSSYIGSSNVHIAMLNDTAPIGTHAHEWFMYHAAIYGFKEANRKALENWVEVYQGDLGVALSDTYTTDVFFRQFNKKFAKLFDGVRHDSGDPIVFAKKTIEHYKSLKINPLFKHIIFSDGLNPEKVEAITKATQGTIGISFGIGTNLTNDTGLDPMNIVIKLTEVYDRNSEWVPAVKLSDEAGKTTGESKMVKLAQQTLNIDQ